MNDDSRPGSCCLCGGASFQRIMCRMRYETESVPWKCYDCGLVFLHPFMSSEEESRYYDGEYARIHASEKGADISNLSSVMSKDAKMYYRWVSRYLRDGRKCLDVGCASGYFLEELRRNGHEACGVDTHEGMRGMCLASGFQAYPSIHHCEPESFDCVFAFFVLEHTSDPVGLLRGMMRVLRHGGLMFIVVPNVDDALFSVYDIQAFRDFYFTPAHQFYYSKETLSAMLHSAGLDNHEILPMQRYDLGNHIHWMMTGKPGGQGKYAGLLSRGTEQMYAADLRHNFKCDTLMAVVEER